jgi:hypothetical protein
MSFQETDCRGKDMVARVVSAEGSSIHETSIVSLAAITMFYLAIAVAPSMADHRWSVFDWQWPEYYTCGHIPTDLNPSNRPEPS